MSKYNANAAVVHDLVHETEVHRDVYVDQEIFDLEMEHLFANTWIYVGHDSQVPHAGDYYGTTIGKQPVHDGAPHRRRGPRPLQSLPAQGHAHHHRHLRQCRKILPLSVSRLVVQDRRLAARDPAAQGLRAHRAGTERSRQGHCARSACEELSRLRVRQDERCRADFEEYFGESCRRSTTWWTARQSAASKLPAACCDMYNCNWKMLVENLTDTCHPMVAHESSAGTAIEVWKKMFPGGNKKPPAVEIFAPFMSPYEMFEKMGIRIWRNGHGHTGVHHSIHSDYSAIPGYFDQMVAAYGEQRAKAILDENRHNTSYFPNFTVKGPIQAIRLFKPIAPNRTLADSWTFRLVDAPDQLLERTLTYSRLINAPTSVVAHDDLEMYERAQEGLQVDANPWVNIQRLYRAGGGGQETAVVNGTSEWQMRNQFRAWSKFMTMSL